MASAWIVRLCELDPLAMATFLPFRSATLLDRRVLRNEDRRSRSRRARDVDEIGLGSLGEDRRRIADHADIDRAGAQRLQQRRAELELDPLDVVDAELLEALLEHLALLGDHQDRAALLVADPELLGCSAAVADAGAERAGSKVAPSRPDRKIRLVNMILSFLNCQIWKREWHAPISCRAASTPRR